MLSAIGVDSLEDLFSHLPAEVRLKRPLDIAPGKSRIRDRRLFSRARRGERQRLRVVSGRRRLSSLPAGAGGHGGFARRVPDFLHALSGRDLARHADHDLRISDHDLPVDRHGSGQRVHVRRLDGGAGSGHDGDAHHRAATGSLVARTVHPEYREVLQTYAQHQGMPVAEFGYDATSGADRSGGSREQARRGDRGGNHSIAEFLRHRGRRASSAAEIAHRHGALLIFVFAEAVSLGLLEPPRDADIVAGELQSFAISPSYGGPFAGIIATKEKFMRQMPGRHGRRNQGLARQSRLLPDAGHARAAHPPREGDFQHLHQPGAHRADGHGLHDRLRQSRACASWPSRTWPKRTIWPGSCRCDSRAVLQRIRGVDQRPHAGADQRRAAEARRSSAGCRSERFYPELRNCDAAVRHRDEPPRAAWTRSRRRSAR